jgi:ketosteroid isomerase-like protein
MKNFLIMIAGVLCFSATSMANESAAALQEAFVAGLVANDAQALADCYAPDAINFPVSTLVGHGPDSVAESWGGFFSSFKVIAADLSDGHLEIHGDTAIAWGFFKIVAEPIEGGEAVEMLGRYMDVARNFDGHWLYVADHASIPPPAAE